MEKKPKDRRGQRRKHSRVFNGVFPGPLVTGVFFGGGWGFRWAAKFASLTATHPLWQKSVLFYGSYMIRPPGLCKDYNRCVFRWLARRHRPKVPVVQRSIFLIVRYSVNAVGPPYMAAVPRPAPAQSLPCVRGGARRAEGLSVSCFVQSPSRKRQPPLHKGASVEHCFSS